MMMNLLLICCLVVLCALSTHAFAPSSSALRLGQRTLKMEYIPDGLTKAQWEQMKKKEEEESKKKNLGAVGITKFKSRSFEAWQKSGQTHLFPVDPSTPLEQRPYMQRTNGAPDGSDLKARGLQGKGQGKELPKLQVDKKYEQLEKEGKLRSAPFTIPWTAEEAAKLSAKNAEEKKKANQAKAMAGSKAGAKPATAPAPEEPPKKKGFFGLF